MFPFALRRERRAFDFETLSANSFLRLRSVVVVISSRFGLAITVNSYWIDSRLLSRHPTNRCPSSSCASHPYPRQKTEESRPSWLYALSPCAPCRLPSSLPSRLSPKLPSLPLVDTQGPSRP